MLLGGSVKDKAGPALLLRSRGASLSFFALLLLTMRLFLLLIIRAATTGRLLFD